MNQLDGRYAGKSPPDNTIKRIEALEKLTKELKQSQDKNQSDDNKNQLQDDEQDKRIAILQAEMKKALQMIEALGTPQPSTGGQFDASQIMIQINMVLVQLKQKADNNKYEELRDELGKFKVEYYKFRE